MQDDKNQILKQLCYTDLVYGRINKKLKIDLTKNEIEVFIKNLLKETPISFYVRKGKNYSISNDLNKIRITINSNTFRVITVDRIK